MKLLFLGGVGFQEVLLIMLVVLLLFGGKKIPELMKGLGQGVRNFKEGMRESAAAEQPTKSDAVNQQKPSVSAEDSVQQELSASKEASVSKN